MDAVHESLVVLSPTQRQVVVALKRRGEASAEELAEALGITPSGVRQHLAALRAA
ncbi:MAG: helix-turn-helix domain-containing protein, partial [Acidimicrobiaceae bacterium]|nr:helix-turn-helix domain-containing protein [Acidimicrobiaceae bacterium]